MKNIDKVRVRCKKCGDILAPDRIGTMIWCKCGAIAVDGKYDKTGEGYCRIIGHQENYEQVGK